MNGSDGSRHFSLWWSCLLAVLFLASVPAEAQSNPDGSLKSSESGLSPAPSSQQQTQGNTTQPDAWTSLLDEWEVFVMTWDQFYPALQALGIELEELPSYLENLTASLETERKAKERMVLEYKTQLAGLEITLRETRAELEKTEKSRKAWRAGTITATGIALLLAMLHIVL